MNFHFDINESAVLARHGLEEGGRVQQFIDQHVINYCDPIVPYKVGDLKGSAETHTLIGSGEVIYKTPYARRQYYEEGYRHAKGRSAKWFEKMKASKGKLILEGAQNLL